MSTTRNGNRVFVAPSSHIYDARLVEVLHAVADEGISLKSVVFFTTTLSQFKFFGIEPSPDGYQHWGLLLESSRTVEGLGFAWRYITLEMTSGGMMWTLSMTKPRDGYDYMRILNMTYDDLSFREVAQYLSYHRDETYMTGVHDCQTEALELFDRLQTHGKHFRDVVYLTLVVAAGLDEDTVNEDIRQTLCQNGAFHACDLQIKLEMTASSCGAALPDVESVLIDRAREVWEACSEPLQLMHAAISVPSGQGSLIIETMQTVVHNEHPLSVGSKANKTRAFIMAAASLDQVQAPGPKSTTDQKFHNGDHFSTRFVLICLGLVVILSSLLFFIYKLWKRFAGMPRSAREVNIKLSGPKAVGVVAVCTSSIVLFVVGAAWALYNKFHTSQENTRRDIYTEVDSERQPLEKIQTIG
jgi:hypothetical protein